MPKGSRVYGLTLDPDRPFECEIDAPAAGGNLDGLTEVVHALELLKYRNALIFRDLDGNSERGDKIMAAIESYRAGDGAVRFVANIVGALDSDERAVGNFDQAVEALIDMLNTDNSVTREDKSGFAGLLLSSAFAYQAVDGARQAVSPDGGAGLETRLGFASDSILRLVRCPPVAG